MTDRSVASRFHLFLTENEAVVMTIAAAITALATIVNVVVAGLQWNAIVRTNKISRTSAVIAQRAFVFRSTFDVFRAINSRDGKAARVFVPQWKNSGSTSANEVAMYANRVIKNSPLPQDFDYPDNPPSKLFPNESDGKTVTLIGPDATSGGSSMAFLEEELDRVNKGKTHAYLYGWVEYADAFGCNHKTEFCTEILNYQGDQVFWNDCPQHNCVDSKCADFKPINSTFCADGI